jgi:hypothetical protein
MTGVMYKIMEWPLSVSVMIILALCVIVPWLAVRVVRRVWPPPALKEDNELVGFTYAVYGLIYGVLLTFTIIVAWERFAETERLVMHEATLLSEIWRDSNAFPAPVREGIHTDLIAYVQSVVDDEWPAMAALGKAHPKTRDVYERLWAHTYRVQPETKNQEAYLPEFLARMNELSGARRLRILYSRMEVHRILWMVLLFGAVPTIAYTLLFSNKHAWIQRIIMGWVMLIVMMGLLITLSLQYPFSGDVSIQPDAFRDLQESFHQRAAAGL